MLKINLLYHIVKQFLIVTPSLSHILMYNKTSNRKDEFTSQIFAAREYKTLSKVNMEQFLK